MNREMDQKRKEQMEATKKRLQAEAADRGEIIVDLSENTGWGRGSLMKEATER